MVRVFLVGTSPLSSPYQLVVTIARTRARRLVDAVGKECALRMLNDIAVDRRSENIVKCGAREAKALYDMFAGVRTPKHSPAVSIRV